MRVVIDKSEVFELETLNIFDVRIQIHPRQRSAIARQLFSGLVEMVLVKMEVAERVDEIARRKIDSLRHHHGEECVGRNVERHAKKQIAAALIKLAAQFASLFAIGRIRRGGNIKLK